MNLLVFLKFEKTKELRKMEECEKNVVELLMASKNDGNLNGVKVLKNFVEEKCCMLGFRH